MAKLVRCPVCCKVHKTDARTQFYFRCCRLSHDIQSNTIGESHYQPSLVKTSKDVDKETSKIPKSFNKNEKLIPTKMVNINE